MWIARDKDGCLYLYVVKPKRSQSNYWFCVDTQNTPLNEDDCMLINGELFPDLRWEDEPIEVELVRKDEKQ